MKILYFTQYEGKKNDGIYKKINFEIESLKNLGNEVDFIYIEEEKENFFRVFKSDTNEKTILEKFKKRYIKFTRYIFYNKIYQKILEKNYDIIYIRYYQNSFLFFNSFLKRIKKNAKAKVILEIPTYPYDGEHIGEPFVNKIKIILEKRGRKKLKEYIEKIVTFSNDEEIFGIPCINISNGINLNKINLIEKKEKINRETINLTSVSVTCFWHGVDRILNSILEYKKNGGNKKLIFNIVGEGTETPKLKKMVEDNLILKNSVIFHGFKSGKELDRIYNNTDIAIGSLGIHRIKGLKEVQPLKNREYCAKGLPFVISFRDPDFIDKDFVYSDISNDDTNFDIGKIIKWYENLKITPEEMREYSKQFSWDIQMKKVVDNIGEQL